MKKIFALRLDIESNKGIEKGLPKILDLLKKYKLKASFYLVMGGESNLIELFRYREKMSGERQIKVFSFFEKFIMLLLPRDFVKSNIQILKRIISEGHELGIHAWKHRAWTRGFEKIDLENHIILSIKKYKKLFNKEPISFAAPAFKTNQKVINLLEKYKISIISDLPGSKPYKIKKNKIINVPITIIGRKNTPIIEYLATKGYSDTKILSYLKANIRKKNYAIIYGHDMFECIQKISLMKELFKFIKKEKIQVKTIKEIAKGIK